MQTKLPGRLKKCGFMWANRTSFPWHHVGKVPKRTVSSHCSACIARTVFSESFSWMILHIYVRNYMIYMVTSWYSVKNSEVTERFPLSYRHVYPSCHLYVANWVSSSGRSSTVTVMLVSVPLRMDKRPVVVHKIKAIGFPHFMSSVITYVPNHLKFRIS